MARSFTPHSIAVKPISIVAVEDNDEVREHLSKVFSNQPQWSLLKTFCDAETALAEIANLAPDVVIMDLRLPGRSGISATRALKLLLPASQVIIFTISAESEDLMDALKAGASGYMLKHCSPDELKDAVLQAWGGGVPMSPGIARKVLSALYEPYDEEGQRLTPREEQILDLLGKGFVPKEISNQLDLQLSTIRWHIRSIYSKLHVRSRVEAVAKRRV